MKKSWKKGLTVIVALLVLAVAAGCGSSPAADKQADKKAPAAFKPEKPVTLVVPMAAGGSTDMLARAVEKVWS